MAVGGEGVLLISLRASVTNLETLDPAERMVETGGAAVDFVSKTDMVDSFTGRMFFLRFAVASSGLSSTRCSAGLDVAFGGSSVGIKVLETVCEIVDMEELPPDSPEDGLDGPEPGAPLGMTEEEVVGLSPSPAGPWEPMDGLLLSLGWPGAGELAARLPRRRLEREDRVESLTGSPLTTSRTITSSLLIRPCEDML